LIAVAGSLMAAYSLLDFIKKLRHPMPPAPSVPPGQSVRMSRALRWQHGMVLVSFSLLVYSGFALNYPDTWWAAPLLVWEPQVPLRGLLHRGAACVMIAAFLWHAAHVVSSSRLRTCMRGISPAFKDVRDAGAMLAYYLGRRSTPPRMGRFNYIEKVEYWGFLWGSLVMTVSGLSLWLVDTTLRYLPTWVPDVATAIHFYEAILATLALLLWHFYRVIFDPDVYPVDWAFWSGDSAASRVRERNEALAPLEGTGSRTAEQEGRTV